MGIFIHFYVFQDEYNDAINESVEKIHSSYDAMNPGMEKLIPAMNKIMDVRTQMGINMQFDFPQIAVIGSQSAGKSSILVNFVGR